MKTVFADTYIGLLLFYPMIRGDSRLSEHGKRSVMLVW